MLYKTIVLNILQRFLVFYKKVELKNSETFERSSAYDHFMYMYKYMYMTVINFTCFCLILSSCVGPDRMYYIRYKVPTGTGWRILVYVFGRLIARLSCGQCT